MDIGTVGYKDTRRVKTVKNVENNKDLIRELLKSEKEAYPDFR